MGQPKIVAAPKSAPPLNQQEAKLLGDVMATRRSTFWGRFRQGFAYATKTVLRDEFDRVCLAVIVELNGKSMTPDDAQAKAKRLICAYTQAEAGCIVPKCDYSDAAVLVAWLGSPQSGFLFQKALTLKDPRGNKRA